MLLYLKVLYILTVFLFTFFIKLSVGQPVKDLLMVALFGLLFITYHRTVLGFLNRHMSVVAVFAVFAIVGALVTILSGRPAADLVNSFLRIIVQPFLILSCTYVLTRLSGVRFTAGVFIGMALLTSAFAVLQFAGIEPAWAIKEAIARIQNEPRNLQDIIEAQGRPMGLSLTPIVFSYHIASAYVIASLLYRFGYLRGGLYLVLALVLLVAAVANGTRSLVIGIILYELLHNFMKLSLRSLISCAAIVVVAVIGYFYLEGSGSRVASLNDASAMGRFVLYEYGLRLAGDHPLGFGWDFKPYENAWLYWEHLSDSAKSMSIFHLKIHNAFINFFLTYGVLGLVAVGFAFYINPKRFMLIVTTFTVYFVHSAFHNDGVFLGENYFWYAFAVLLFVCDEREGVRDRMPVPVGPATGAVAAGVRASARPPRRSRR